MATLKYLSTLGTGFQKSTISNGGSGYTSGATSIVVADGAVFPATGDFYVGVGDSDPPDFIKLCTARTTNTLTVDAAVVAGTDGNKADGVAVQWVLPPEGLDQLRADQNRELTVAAFDALAATEYKNGDRIFLSDSVYEVCRIGGAWSYRHGTYKVSRPPSAGWTWDNQDSATLDSTNGYEYAYFPRSGAAHISVRYRTAPTPPYFIIAGYLWNLGATPPGTNGNNLDVNFGLFFRDGDDGKIIAYTFGPEAGAPYLAQTWRWTNSTTRSTVHAQSSAANLTMLQLMGSKSPVWMAIADDGTTNLTFWWSIDRQHWELFDTWAREDFMTGGPTQVAWGAYNGNGPQWDALIDWTEGSGASP